MKMHGKENHALTGAKATASSVHGLVVIALGANLPSRFGTPTKTLEAALRALARSGPTVYRRSPWYRSAAVPRGSGPPFINGVALVETTLRPAALLSLLHGIERRFGRRRRAKNEPRVLDLDLIDYRSQISESLPVLPHPRAHERAFVLLPLADVAPAWRHPLSKRGARDLARHVEHGGTRRIGRVRGRTFIGARRAAAGRLRGAGESHT